MPDRTVWWATFSDTPGEKEHAYGREKKVHMPPELAGIPDYGRKRKKAADGSGRAGASSLSMMIVQGAKTSRPKLNL